MEMASPLLVCFGDSLTAGYQMGGDFCGDTPYGGFLQQWLGPRANIFVTGICGEVTSDMVKRFPRDVVRRNPKMTVILGGTNDLGMGVPPWQISQNLERLYGLALEAGVNPVGVTVPSIRMDSGEERLARSPAHDSEPSIPPWLKSHIDHRLELNHKIVEICRTLTIPFLDLFTETAEGAVQMLAARYSSDGLHFNTAGYEAFARLVWRHLLADSFGPDPQKH